MLDTNVLIQSPNALEAFEENQIVIPMVVVEELDKLKNAEGEKGRNVRESIRLLEMLRQKGDLCQGVELGNGGLVRIEMNYINVELPEDLPDYKMDHRILKVCKGLKEEKKNEKVILVTKDILLRIKAQALGILSEDFQTEQVPKEPSQYTGRREVYAPEKAQKRYRRFAIKVEKDKLTKTDYYFSNTYRDNGSFHSNPVVMGFKYAFDDETYDRIYVAELEDGNRILVRLFERALNLSEDTIILPIGEKIIYKDSYSPFEKINESIELTTEDATKWHVDASGYYFRQNYLLDKVSASGRSWGIMIGGIVIYMIVSSVFLLMYNKRHSDV